MMDYITYRRNALQGLTLLPAKQKEIMTKDEIENWIKKEYERHYKNKREGEY